MQNHAAKQGDDEGDAPQCGVNIMSGVPVIEPQKGEQQQKREVKINVNAEQFAEFERPFHKGTIFVGDKRLDSRSETAVRKFLVPALSFIIAWKPRVKRRSHDADERFVVSSR